MKPLTCKYCGRKFHKGKTNAFGRMSRHIWKEHAESHRRNIKKGQKKAKSKLEQELEYTDDMIIQALQDHGVSITPVRQQQIGYPQQQPMYAPIPYQNQPTDHESIAGAIMTAFKVGMAIKEGIDVAKKIKKVVKKK